MPFRILSQFRNPIWWRIPGYKLVKENDPSNNKRGGVCVYYKSSLPFKVINVKYLQKSISFYLTVVLGGFNAKSNNWCKADITSLERSKIDTIASSYGLNQLIQEPTHILHSSSSCIHLIFTSQPNLVMESGIHSSMHSNCYH